MAGTLDLIQRIYLGAEIREGVMLFTPRLRERLDGLSLLMQFRGTPIRVVVEGDELIVEALTEGFSQSVSVGVGEDVCVLAAGQRCRFTLRSPVGSA